MKGWASARVIDGYKARPRRQASQAVVPVKIVRMPTRACRYDFEMYHAGRAMALLSSKEMGGNEFASVSIQDRSLIMKIEKRVPMILLLPAHFARLQTTNAGRGRGKCAHRITTQLPQRESRNLAHRLETKDFE